MSIEEEHTLKTLEEKVGRLLSYVTSLKEERADLQKRLGQLQGLIQTMHTQQNKLAQSIEELLADEPAASPGHHLTPAEPAAPSSEGTVLAQEFSFAPSEQLEEGREPFIEEVVLD